MKIQGLFSDFDGTLSPLEVRREDAIISLRLRRLLTKIGKRIPIGIVSTKDLAFIRDRMPFVHGIAGISGIEMQIGERIIKDENAMKYADKVEKACQEAIPKILRMGDEIVIERKTTEDDELVAFCIDWRLSRNWEDARKKVDPILRQCREEGLYILEPDSSPFANVYGIQVDKGWALRQLRTELGAEGPIAYLGDSEADNPAFDVADVSIGVRHRRVMPKLTCKYQLTFLEVEIFLLRLLDADLNFSEEMVESNPNFVHPSSS